MSKTPMCAAAAICLTERCPSIFDSSSHSIVLRLIWPSRLSRITNSGTRSTDGIFFERTRHSSSRRAASISRFVLLFWMLTRAVGAPASKRNSPLRQIASAYTASSPARSSTSAWTILPSASQIRPWWALSSRWKTPVFPLTLTSWMMSGRCSSAREPWKAIFVHSAGG